MSQMWNGVGENYFGNLSVAKRTALRATMGRPLRLWVAFGDRATIFGQHWLTLAPISSSLHSGGGGGNGGPGVKWGGGREAFDKNRQGAGVRWDPKSEFWAGVPKKNWGKNWMWAGGGWSPGVAGVDRGLTVECLTVWAVVDKLTVQSELWVTNGTKLSTWQTFHSWFDHIQGAWKQRTR